jgi:hypothetical protein
MDGIADSTNLRLDGTDSFMTDSYISPPPRLHAAPGVILSSWAAAVPIPSVTATHEPTVFRHSCFPAAFNPISPHLSPLLVQTAKELLARVQHPERIYTNRSVPYFLI